MPNTLLSKSRYLNGLQCLKYLWLTVNDPEKVPEPDPKSQRLFDQGQLVQQYAEKLFPDGSKIPSEEFQRNIDLTTQALKKRIPLFEAGIVANNVYSRIDILKPYGNNSWDIFEVKSSTKVKDENLHDISFQRYCCEKYGLVINKCYLIYINNQYVKSGSIDPQKLFIIEDVTGNVLTVGIGIEDRIRTMLDTLGLTVMPDLPIGSHCSDPYDCPITFCYDSLPENNILELYRGGKKRFELLYNGIMKMRDIPGNTKLTKAQETQKWCDANSQPYINRREIKAFLDKLIYPVCFLDFETFNTAIPLFDGVRPYQQIPFQFSLHIVDKKDKIEHFSFLSDGQDDPRKKFLDNLMDVIGYEGSIMTYNQTFEESILKALEESFPKIRDRINNVCSRLVDLLKPFRNFDYYHPSQRGSASIKNVLPALTGQSYDDMEINNGDAASLAYLTMTYENITEAEKKNIRVNLEKYCGLDTEGMIWIVNKLKSIC